jgi:hypothetical protein
VSGASIAPCSTRRTASHSARRSYQTIEQLQADLDAWINATGCSSYGGLVADQRLPAPVLVMNENRRCSILFHCAGAGWQMADGDAQAKFVGQRL